MYAKIENGAVVQYPYTMADFAADHPNVTLASQVDVATLAEFGVVHVVVTGQPEHDRITHTANEGEPALINGSWRQTWSVSELSAETAVENLAAARANLIAQINARRDDLETQGFPHAGLWFQSDERSVARINSTALTASAALMAGQAAAFPDWLAADNTPLPVDAAGMLALQSALTQHAGLLHQHARNLKSQVESATTSAELDAIDLNTGWPV